MRKKFKTKFRLVLKQLLTNRSEYSLLNCHQFESKSERILLFELFVFIANKIKNMLFIHSL